MKKHFLVLLIFSILSTSCFEILEDVTLKKDGSGTFKLTVNLSQSAAQLSKILSQDSINGYPIPSEEQIKTKIGEAINQITEQSGIHNLTHSTNFEDYIFKIQFDFDSTACINSAMNQIIKINDPKAALDPVNYNWDGTTLTRNFNEKTISKAKSDKDAFSAVLVGFENAKLTTILRFENEISTVVNQKGKISSSKKNYFQQSSIDNLLENNSYQTIQIITK